jgi:hypothetical protein
MAYFIGVLVMVLVWITLGVTTNTWNPLDFAMGTDGRRSTSKLQFLVWTAVVVFAFVTVYCARVIAEIDHGLDALTSLPQIPLNLFLLMGFSATTTIGAKGITVAYKRAGEITKPDVEESEKNPGGLITKDDSDTPDLAKIQMLVWTYVGILFYVVALIAFVQDERYLEGKLAIPDVDSALIVLMGVGQGAYLGNKLVSRDVPGIGGFRIDDYNLTDNRVTLVGGGFGAQKGSNFVYVIEDGKETIVRTTSMWSGDQIEFDLPPGVDFD